jgi:hypothetical protein
MILGQKYAVQVYFHPNGMTQPVGRFRPYPQPTIGSSKRSANLFAKQATTIDSIEYNIVDVQKNTQQLAGLLGEI